MIGRRESPPLRNSHMFIAKAGTPLSKIKFAILERYGEISVIPVEP